MDNELSLGELEAVAGGSDTAEPAERPAATVAVTAFDLASIMERSPFVIASQA